MPDLQTLVVSSSSARDEADFKIQAEIGGPSGKDRSCNS
jgi:hypothetical protein